MEPISSEDYGRQLAAINASGFPLQFWAEERIRDRRNHECTFEAREVAWNHPVTGESGYIDLVARHGRIKVVVECKQNNDWEWLFLIPIKEQKDTEMASVNWVSYSTTPLHCDEFPLSPRSGQSSFCIAKHSKKNEKMLLEPIASNLLMGVEGLAQAEIIHLGQGGVEIYMPVILTTAKLFACTIDPGKIPEETTFLPASTNVPVPYIRFRKSLFGDWPATNPDQRDDFKWRAGSRERTVFVVQTTYFEKFLQLVGTSAVTPFSEWPWRRR